MMNDNPPYNPNYVQDQNADALPLTGGCFFDPAYGGCMKIKPVVTK